MNEEFDFESNVDPIHDIIDYLVRCANISFKNAHLNESEIRTSTKTKMACDLYNKSPTDFLLQYGKYLTLNHLKYFEELKLEDGNQRSFKECIKKLKEYHSEESTHKRVRNRRFKALQKLQNEGDYFSETQMMLRNPLLYEQLVGQYLSDDDIMERDGVDRENLTLLNLILDTVDRNQMRERKNEQMLEEGSDSVTLVQPKIDENEDTELKNKNQWGAFEEEPQKQWGGFTTPDTRPHHKPEARKQIKISTPERRLLKEEFLQEMYNSFIEGRDTDIDYTSIDKDEQYDDLKQLSQDAEDKYFDSQPNEVENLEEHMELVKEYGTNKSQEIDDDPLEVFMAHNNISNRLNNS